MGHYDKVDAYNLVAPQYDSLSKYLTLGVFPYCHKIIVNFIKSLPETSNLRVLDIATATGSLPFLVSAGCPNVSEIVGVDASKQMIIEANKKLMDKSLASGKKVKFLEVNAFDLPFTPHSFDIVTVCFSFRNFLPRSAVLFQISKMLKDKGLLLVVERGLPEFVRPRELYQDYQAFIPQKIFSPVKNILAETLHKFSAEQFPKGREFVAELHENNFMNPEYEVFLGGLVYFYKAENYI